MSLTEAGTLYHERVGRILDDLEEADEALGPLQSEPTGTLRVSAPMTLTLACLSPALPKFLDRHPGLSVDLQMDDRRTDIVEEGFDIAIRSSDRLENSSLIARRLMGLPHVVCAAPSYLEQRGAPRTPDDLKHHNCILFTLSGHVSEWTFRGGDRSVTVAVGGRYRVTSSLAVRDALLAGFGLSLIPRLYVQADLERGRLRTVLDDWSTVDTAIYAVYPSRRYLSAKVRCFLDFLVDEFRQAAWP